MENEEKIKNKEIILNIKELFKALNKKTEFEGFETSEEGTTLKSPLFSHILTQTNNTMDGYRGRIINSFEKSPIYFVKLEKKNDTLIVTLLKENSSFYYDKTNYSKSDEIIISKTFTKSEDNKEIDYEKLEVDISSLIFDFIIKQNWTDETFDYDKLYINYSNNVTYNNDDNFDENKVFAKSMLSLKPKNVMDQNDFFYFKNKNKNNKNKEKILEIVKNAKDFKNLSREDKKKIKELFDSRINKKKNNNKNPIQCSCHRDKQEHLFFNFRNYLKDQSMQMDFMMEFFPITKSDKNNKEISKKVGYFTTQWHDTTPKIATIKPVSNTIYIYIDKSSNDHKDEVETSIKYWKSVFREAANNITLTILQNSNPFDDNVFRYLNSITITDNIGDFYGVANCVLDSHHGNIILSNASFCSLNHGIKGNDLSLNYINEMSYSIIEEDHEKLGEYGLKGEDREETISKLIKYTKINTITHEIGHCLGLRHNFAGTTTIDGKSSNTVMDYVFLDDGKYTVLGDSDFNKIGLYDKYAIQYGYGNLSNSDLEKKKDILFVTDGSDIWFLTIGSSDNENTIDKTGIDKYIEKTQYWIDMYQNLDPTKSKIIGGFQTKEHYFQAKYYFSQGSASFYKDQIIYNILGGIYYYDIKNGKVRYLLVEEIVKLLDFLVQFYVNRKLLSKEQKDLLINFDWISNIDGIQPMAFIYTLEFIDYVTTFIIIIQNFIEIVPGTSSFDNLITYYERFTKTLIAIRNPDKKWWQYWKPNKIGVYKRDYSDEMEQIMFRIYTLEVVLFSYLKRERFIGNNIDRIIDMDGFSEYLNSFNKLGKINDLKGVSGVSGGGELNWIARSILYVYDKWEKIKKIPKIKFYHLFLLTLYIYNEDGDVSNKKIINLTILHLYVSNLLRLK